MTEFKQIYRCNICGNITEVLHDGEGQLVCCGEPMQLKEANTVDASEEKHVPVIESNGSMLIVKVGSVPHPMEPGHYVEWIEIDMKDVGRITKKYLKPGDKPEVEFHVRGENFEVRAYCNLHGLWKA